MSIRIDIDVCRVCCKSDASNSIFKYAKKFHYCTSLEVVEHDGLPAKICNPCLERMKIAVDFRRKSECSDRQLRNFIANVNSQFHLALEISDDEDDDEDATLIDVVNAQDCEVTESVQPETAGPMNSALGSKRPGSVEQNYESDLEQEVEAETEPEQEQEKFRAVAVIQEKPAIKSPKPMYEVVELEYEDNLQPNEIVMEEQEHEPQELPMDETEDDEEQVIYITLPDYQEEQSTAQDEEDDIMVHEQKHVKESQSSSKLDESNRQIETTVTDGTVSTPNSFSHKSVDKFPCLECNKHFSTKTNLNRHLQTHNGNKPYVCLICHKGFTQNGSLKQHMFIHQNLRPYVCQVCDKGFTQPKSLTFHMRRHTNEKPFVCPHCSYAFRQKDGLKRHLLRKHTEKDMRDFPCDLCGKAFQSRYTLSVHMKRHEAKGESDSIIAKVETNLKLEDSCGESSG